MNATGIENAIVIVAETATKIVIAARVTIMIHALNRALIPGRLIIPAADVMIINQH